MLQASVTAPLPFPVAPMSVSELLRYLDEQEARAAVSLPSPAKPATGIRRIRVVRRPPPRTAALGRPASPPPAPSPPPESVSRRRSSSGAPCKRVVEQPVFHPEAYYKYLARQFDAAEKKKRQQEPFWATGEGWTGEATVPRPFSFDKRPSTSRPFFPVPTALASLPLPHTLADGVDARSLDGRGESRRRARPRSLPPGTRSHTPSPQPAPFAPHPLPLHFVGPSHAPAATVLSSAAPVPAPSPGPAPVAVYAPAPAPPPPPLPLPHTQQQASVSAPVQPPPPAVTKAPSHYSSVLSMVTQSLLSGPSGPVLFHTSSTRSVASSLSQPSLTQPGRSSPHSSHSSTLHLLHPPTPT